jgi:hypothetical protein
MTVGGSGVLRPEKIGGNSEGPVFQEPPNTASSGERGDHPQYDRDDAGLGIDFLSV